MSFLIEQYTIIFGLKSRESCLGLLFVFMQLWQMILRSLCPKAFPTVSTVQDITIFIGGSLSISFQKIPTLICSLKQRLSVGVREKQKLPLSTSSKGGLQHLHFLMYGCMGLSDIFCVVWMSSVEVWKSFYMVEGRDRQENSLHHDAYITPPQLLFFNSKS